jgi:Mrp family chromosome partitioning ATPase
VDELLGAPSAFDGLFLLDHDDVATGLAGRSPESSLDQLLPRLRERYGLCIFDLPPVLDDAHGASLAAKLDATVIVIHSGRTTIEDVRRAERVLSKNGASLSGAVLNRCRD